MKLKFQAQKKPRPFTGMSRTVKIAPYCLPQEQKGDLPSAEVITEYLLYKAVAAAGVTTFHVRLVHITYYDCQAKKFTEGMAIVLEPKKDLAQSRKATIATPDLIQRIPLNKAIRFLLVQAMIANTDWTVEKGYLRNMILLQLPDATTELVPFDFDLAFFPDPAVAKNDLAQTRLYKVGLEHARMLGIMDRFVKGGSVEINPLLQTLAVTDAQVQTAFIKEGTDLLSHKESILALTNTPFLSSVHQAAIYRHFQMFFRLLEDALARR